MHPFQTEQLAADRRLDLLRSAERVQLAGNGRRLPWPSLPLALTRRRRPRVGRPTTGSVPATGALRCATC